MDSTARHSHTMLSHPIVSHSMSLGLPDKVHLPGVAANALLATGAVLLKPALDFLLISGFPDSSVATLGGDVAYSKGLTLVLEPTVKGYQHHDVVVPFLRTTKPILSSMPLQPSAGVMFGMTACFLSLAAAGTFLVRSHTGSESGGPSSTPMMSSLPETSAYNRGQRQAQNGRAAAHRRGRRWRELSILLAPAMLADKIHFDVFPAPDPVPPNNNQNNIPVGIKPHAPSKSLLTNRLSIFVTDYSLH